MKQIHHLSDVQTSAIGEGTTIWQFCVVLGGAVIGQNCNLCAGVFIENDVVIGDNVTIKTGADIFDGVTIHDNVFIGSNVVFTNDLTPRSKVYLKSFDKTTVQTGASIGANVTIIAGITIGEYAMVGAGSVVTKNIPANTLWYGNPARHKGYVTNEGVVLNMDKIDGDGKIHKL